MTNGTVFANPATCKANKAKIYLLSCRYTGFPNKACNLLSASSVVLGKEICVSVCLCVCVCA